FFSINNDKNMVYLSSSGEKNYCSINYKDDMFLVFGKESVGLPKNIIAANLDKLYKIPIYSSHVRSLNLANAVSIVVYDGLRNIK
ncbi:MAG: tRNA (uridine(34)/cytosine(34)/5-carboxymethylaminomethyluridine(34)-2'-O)-methyltransferase TrmL, partial [Lutibacter sp.]|nr:tRNA (uridine(34)/cytosine(34)/5-carboxymethylaminomethyluridine(34)-2'-O)-methyltransferase TrmL [Lutibacter sp.]